MARGRHHELTSAIIDADHIGFYREVTLSRLVATRFDEELDELKIRLVERPWLD